MGELTEAIKNTDEYHARNIERLPAIPTANRIFLDRSIKQNKVLEIQLNSLDEYDRVKPHVFGVFRGMAEFDVVLIGENEVDFMILETFRFIISPSGVMNIYLKKNHLKKKQNIATQ